MSKFTMPERGIQRVIRFIMDLKGLLALTCLMWKDEMEFMIAELELMKIHATPHTITFITACQVWVEAEYLDSIGEREDGQ